MKEELTESEQDTLAVLRYHADPQGMAWHGPRSLAKAIGDPTMQGYADAHKALEGLQAKQRIEWIKTAWPPPAVDVIRPRRPLDHRFAQWRVLP